MRSSRKSDLSFLAGQRALHDDHFSPASIVTKLLVETHQQGHDLVSCLALQHDLVTEDMLYAYIHEYFLYLCTYSTYSGPGPF